jgi:hypothetical protein
MPLSSLLALHDANRAVSSVTLTLRTTVSPAAAAASPLKLSLEEYAPMYTDTAPPYAFPPVTLTLTAQLSNTLLLRPRLKCDTCSCCSPAESPKYTDNAPPYPERG